MSLTIVSQPQQFVLAGNPAEFRFYTDNLYSAPGDFHKLRLTLTAVPAADKQLIFAWQDVYLLMQTTLTPNDSGYQIGIPAVLPTLTDWVNDTFIPALQGNYYINRDFTVTADVYLGTLRVELTARAKGSAFNIGFSTDVGATLTGASIILGANQTIRPNFQTHLELYIAQLTSSTFARIVASQTHATTESRFQDLESILSSDYYGSALPTFGGAVLQNISAAIIKFYAAYAEAFGEPLQIQKLQETALAYALQGAWGKDYNAQTSFLTNWLAAGKTILAHALSYKIAPGQMHVLNYLHWLTATSFKVYVDIVYTDATNEVLTLHTQAGSVTKPSLWVIPANYAKVAAIANPDKTIYSYQIWVGATGSSATLYSQKITMVVDFRPQLQETALLFKNGFGVYEVARCTGIVTEQSSLSSQTARRQLSADYSVTDAQSVTFGQQEQRKWQVNSGFKSKAEMQQLVALFNSPSVYLIGSYFRPVTLQISDATLAATQSGRINEATFTILADAPLTQGSHV